MSDELRDRIAVDRLAGLRGAMAELEAPDRVKPAVLEAFRAARSRRRVQVFRWVSALAAGLALAAVLYWANRRPVETAAVVALKVAPAAKTPDVPVAPPPPAKLQPVTTARRQAPRPRPKPALRSAPVAPAPLQEVATEFFALPYAPPIDVNDEAQVIRVRLPRSAMRTVGLPVNEDRWFERVPADVLLGQDGIARAVRFVKVAQ
jgi:hypothetical protein